MVNNKLIVLVELVVFFGVLWALLMPWKTTGDGKTSRGDYDRGGC